MAEEQKMSCEAAVKYAEDALNTLQATVARVYGVAGSKSVYCEVYQMAKGELEELGRWMERSNEKDTKRSCMDIVNYLGNDLVSLMYAWTPAINWEEFLETIEKEITDADNLKQLEDIYGADISYYLCRLGEELEHKNPILAENTKDIPQGRYGAPRSWAFVAGQLDEERHRRRTPFRPGKYYVTDLKIKHRMIVKAR